MQFTPAELSILRQAAEIILREQAIPGSNLPGLSNYDLAQMGIAPRQSSQGQVTQPNPFWNIENEKNMI